MATRPGGTMLSESERAELAALRRRGYGPEGGLNASGAARLRALEERALDAAGDDDAPSLSADPASVSRENAPDDDDRDARPARDRWRPVLLSLAAVVVGALLIGVGWTLHGPAESVDAGSLDPVAVDQQRAAVVLGTASFAIRRLDPDTLVQYASLGQGTPWSAADSTGRRCMILTVTDDSPEMIATAGVWDVACAPPGLSPIIDWEVDPSFPSPPQDLPNGSVVRLTLQDDRVGLSVGRAG